MNDCNQLEGISVKRDSLIHAGLCNNCSSHTKYLFVYVIIIRGLLFRLCSKCLKELMKKFKETG